MDRRIYERGERSIGIFANSDLCVKNLEGQPFRAGVAPRPV